MSADLKWLCVHRQQLHNEPSECNNPGAGGSWVIVITYGDKSVEDTVRCPDDLPELPEECHDNNGDPSNCDPSGNGCEEAPPEEEPENTDSDSNPTIGILLEDYPNASELNEALANDPFLLLEVDCDQIQNWQTLAQHTASQSIQDKIDNLPSGIFNDFEIQSLESAEGNLVNLDLFPVNITTLPNNPNTGQQFTPDEFLDYFRRNINNFVDDSTFDPYCQITSICQQETDLWDSNDPTGALVYIDISGDDGTVICSEYEHDYWYFMTLNAPYSGNHPVSGVRQFGYETNSDGSFDFLC